MEKHFIIDTHTHIFNNEIYDSYFKKANENISDVLVMHDYDDGDLNQFLDFAQTKQNVHIIWSFTFKKDVKSQLILLEDLLKQDRIKGIKLYPWYEHFYPSDEGVYPLALLCAKYHKPLIFHIWDVNDAGNTAVMKYSHPIFVDELAVKFPHCNIIIAHFGFPYLLETANIVAKNLNVYTDISATIVDMWRHKHKWLLYNQYLSDLSRVYMYFDIVRRKTMFATDYGGEKTPLNQVEPYIDLVNELFDNRDFKQVCRNLAIKLFWWWKYE